MLASRSPQPADLVWCLQLHDAHSMRLCFAFETRNLLHAYMCAQHRLQLPEEGKVVDRRQFVGSRV